MGWLWFSSVEVMWNSWSNEKQDWKMLERNEMTRRALISMPTILWQPLVSTHFCWWFNFLQNFHQLFQGCIGGIPISHSPMWLPKLRETSTCNIEPFESKWFILSEVMIGFVEQVYISDYRRVEMYPVMQWWVVNLSLLESFLDLTLL